MKTWADTALETLAFHETKQLELGISKRGRPESIRGKIGWSARDTAKALGLSFRKVLEDIAIGKYLRENPKSEFQHRSMCLEFLGKGDAPRKLAIETLLGIVKTQAFILLQDKRTKKIGETLQKAIQSYEG